MNYYSHNRPPSLGPNADEHQQYNPPSWKTRPQQYTSSVTGPAQQQTRDDYSYSGVQERLPNTMLTKIPNTSDWGNSPYRGGGRDVDTTDASLATELIDDMIHKVLEQPSSKPLMARNAFGKSNFHSNYGEMESLRYGENRQTTQNIYRAELPPRQDFTYQGSRLNEKLGGGAPHTGLYGKDLTVEPRPVSPLTVNEFGNGEMKTYEPTTFRGAGAIAQSQQQPWQSHTRNREREVSLPYGSQNEYNPGVTSMGINQSTISRNFSGQPSQVNSSPRITNIHNHGHYSGGSIVGNEPYSHQSMVGNQPPSGHSAPSWRQEVEDYASSLIHEASRGVTSSSHQRNEEQINPPFSSQNDSFIQQQPTGLRTNNAHIAFQPSWDNSPAYNNSQLEKPSRAINYEQMQQPYYGHRGENNPSIDPNQVIDKFLEDRLQKKMNDIVARQQPPPDTDETVKTEVSDNSRSTADTGTGDTVMAFDIITSGDKVKLKPRTSKTIKTEKAPQSRSKKRTEKIYTRDEDSRDESSDDDYSNLKRGSRKVSKHRPKKDVKHIRSKDRKEKEGFSSTDESGSDSEHLHDEKTDSRKNLRGKSKKHSSPNDYNESDEESDDYHRSRKKESDDYPRSRKERRDLKTSTKTRDRDRSVERESDRNDHYHSTARNRFDEVMKGGNNANLSFQDAKFPEGEVQPERSRGGGFDRDDDVFSRAGSLPNVHKVTVDQAINGPLPEVLNENRQDEILQTRTRRSSRDRSRRAVTATQRELRNPPVLPPKPKSADIVPQERNGEEILDETLEKSPCQSTWHDSETLLLPLKNKSCEGALLALAFATLADDNFAIDTTLAMTLITGIMEGGDKSNLIKPLLNHPMKDTKSAAYSFKSVLERTRNYSMENKKGKHENKGQMTEMEFWSECCVLATIAVTNAASNKKRELSLAVAETVLSSIKIEDCKETDWIDKAESKLKDIAGDVSRVLGLMDGGTQSISSLASITIASEGGKRLVMERIRQKSKPKSEMHNDNSDSDSESRKKKLSASKAISLLDTNSNSFEEIPKRKKKHNYDDESDDDSMTDNHRDRHDSGDFVFDTNDHSKRKVRQDRSEQTKEKEFAENIYIERKFQETLEKKKKAINESKTIKKATLDEKEVKRERLKHQKNHIAERMRRIQMRAADPQRQGVSYSESGDTGTEVSVLTDDKDDSMYHRDNEKTERKNKPVARKKSEQPERRKQAPESGLNSLFNAFSPSSNGSTKISNQNKEEENAGFGSTVINLIYKGLIGSEGDETMTLRSALRDSSTKGSNEEKAVRFDIGGQVKTKSIRIQPNLTGSEKQEKQSREGGKSRGKLDSKRGSEDVNVIEVHADDPISLLESTSASDEGEKPNKGSNNGSGNIPLHRNPSPFPRSHDTNDRQSQDSPRVKFPPEGTYGDKDGSRPSSSESHGDGDERSRTTDPDSRPSSSESFSRGKPPVSHQQHHHNKPVLKSWTKDYHRRQGGSGGSRSRSSSITRSRRTKDPSPQPQERPEVPMGRNHARDHISSMVNPKQHGDSWDDDRGNERERSHNTNGSSSSGGGGGGGQSRKSFQKVGSLSMMTEGERRDHEKKVQHVHEQHEHEIAHWPQPQPQRDGLLSQVERRKKEKSGGRRRMSRSPGKFIRKLGKKMY